MATHANSTIVSAFILPALLAGTYFAPILICRAAVAVAAYL